MTNTTSNFNGYDLTVYSTHLLRIATMQSVLLDDHTSLRYFYKFWYLVFGITFLNTFNDIAG